VDQLIYVWEEYATLILNVLQDSAIVMNIVAAIQRLLISVTWSHAQQTLNALDIVSINNVAKRQGL
jgi:hypothetical protein